MELLVRLDPDDRAGVQPDGARGWLTRWRRRCVSGEKVWPLRDHGQEYLSKGWFPIPLPAGQKSPPPLGWTGYAGAYANGPQVFEWGESPRWAHANIGLRLGDDVLGLDVDAYDGKPGVETMMEGIKALGPLPPAPRLTSRDDRVSGIRLYRVPKGRCWADRLGPAVEVIHHGHRYAVAPPSIHPDTGRPYRWLDARGEEMDEVPKTADFPALPATWVDFLDRGNLAARAAKSSLRSGEVSAWIEQHDHGQPCSYLDRLLRELEAGLARDNASRHDLTRQYVGKIVRGADQGHAGLVTALDTAEALLRAQRPLGDALEVDRMVSGAVGFCVAQPTPEDRRGCCPPEPDVSEADGRSFGAGPTSSSRLTPEFWQARPELALIHRWAKARRASPEATLGLVLARVVAAVPPFVVLPPLIGGEVSLNLRWAPAEIRRRPAAPPAGGLVSMADAGRRLGVSRTTAHAWAAAGRLETERHGHQLWVTETSVTAAAIDLGLIQQRSATVRSGHTDPLGEPNSHPSAATRPGVHPDAPGEHSSAIGTRLGGAAGSHDRGRMKTRESRATSSASTPALRHDETDAAPAPSRPKPWRPA